MKHLILSLILLTAFSCREDDPIFNTNIDEVEFQTDDLTNFWAAYDSYEVGSDVGSHFNDNYINKGSTVLKETFEKEGITGSDFGVVFNEYKDFYAAIREITVLRSTEKRSVITAAFRRFQSIYPKASFTDVHFAVGRFNNGGRSVDAGVYVGMEFFSLSTNTPLDELTDWERSNIRDSKGLEIIVCRETVHTLQTYGGGGSILKASIFEGAADFLAELMTEEQNEATRFSYGEENEQDIWTSFKTAIDNDGPATEWVYASSENNPYGYPRNMGFYMGYKIVEAFYNSKTDKAAAVEAILNMTDFEQFLAESGYDG